MEEVIKQIDQLIAREEHRQALALFFGTWNEKPELHSELWPRGLTATILSDNPKVRAFFISGCKQFLRYNPGNLSVLRGIASVYDAGDQHDKSLPIYTKLLKRRLPASTRRDIEYSMAMIYVARKRYSVAKEFLESAIGRIRSQKSFFTPYYGLMGEIEGHLSNMGLLQSEWVFSC